MLLDSRLFFSKCSCQMIVIESFDRERLYISVVAGHWNVWNFEMASAMIDVIEVASYLWDNFEYSGDLPTRVFAGGISDITLKLLKVYRGLSWLATRLDLDEEWTQLNTNAVEFSVSSKLIGWNCSRFPDDNFWAWDLIFPLEQERFKMAYE